MTGRYEASVCGGPWRYVGPTEAAALYWKARAEKAEVERDALAAKVADRDATIARAVDEWTEEADEREARASNPEVCGVVERAAEEAAVRVLRRCVAALRGGE